MKLTHLATPLLSCVLIACSSEDLETANFGSDLNKNHYNYVNATQYEVKYHTANTKLNGDERDATKDKYYIATLARNAEPKRIEHEHNVNRQISFYAQALNNNGNDRQIKYKVKQDQDYHVIAWQDNSKSLMITLLKQQTNNKGDHFALRFLSNADQTITVNNKPLIVSKGAVSSWHYLQNCTSDLKLNGQPVEFCNASFNNSYTLVINNQEIEEIITE
ncbi:hypothetical protein CWB96_05995 [Pseudoalteromonas citrea]|uniref:Uncharacterized protein n=1 Tax=Pseudoalteromonas citrea TaxID=43655 RepID=A0A5S3XRU2_9GAMM|nr:hypothetical protein [Pseudoalteromonas citrea]TMP44362.1 hypothetical protein CWB97_06670 [Pseudoalteromonas citrea]TMP60743.1 hypothetical protein CWB96_05995 [Pseudoalteromonas citrea]